MGCPFSGFLAILFMDRLEKKLIFEYSPLITCYKRYVDDTFIVTKDASSADSIFQAFNSAHPSIQFEMEKPTIVNGISSINMLDLTILTSETSNIDSLNGNTFNHRFYRK